ncbi:MAG: YhgE/Pip domain-containing protein [Bacillus sp. (in: firmicutes)]
MKDQKYFIAAFAAVLILLFVFVSTQIPSARSNAENLPIGLVSEDAGPMGETLLETIQTNAAAAGNTFEFIVLEDTEEMDEMMAEKELYGAIVITSDFSGKYATLQTAEPQSPTLQLYVNQGANATVANVVSQALTTMVTQMNVNMSQQLFVAMEQNNVPLSVQQAKIFASPIQSEVITVNPTGSMASAPASLFQPIWLASVVSALLVWFAGRKRLFSSVGEQVKFRLLQVAVTIALGFFAGYTATWLTTWMLGFEYASFNDVALFASIASCGFILMILAVVSWIGYAGLPIFVLLMFFGLPLVQLVPEMMPEFYANWVYPWLPMRFLFDGLKEILYFGGDVWNGSAQVLSWIAAVSAVLVLAKGSAKQESKNTAVSQN